MENKKFHECYAEWVDTYKVGAVRQATLNKYRQTHAQLEAIAPDVILQQLDRRTYQEIINKYAETHAKQTVCDFHTQLKAFILDAIEEKMLENNPARKVAIKGIIPENTRIKCLSREECLKLVDELDLTKPIKSEERTKHSGAGWIYQVNWDWFILLCLKTGLRFAEAAGLTGDDFDFERNMLNVSKTYDYKFENKIVNDTKTLSSKRKILLDNKLASQFQELLGKRSRDELIFVVEGQRIFNTTVNNRLKTLCKTAGIPEISVHGLRHTHASILFYNGVSLYSVSRRLGHADVTVTQRVYLHLIKELENEDNDKISAGLSMF